MEPISIHSEVRKLISDCVGCGEAHSMNSYVDTIMAGHVPLTGPDADFYMICTRNFIKDVVRGNIGKYAPKSKRSNAQMVLAGFEHLQVAYTFERAGETFLVPADQATDIELARRSQDYRKMGATNFAHADEIDAYVASRSSAAA